MIICQYIKLQNHPNPSQRSNSKYIPIEARLIKNGEYRGVRNVVTTIEIEMMVWSS